MAEQPRPRDTEQKSKPTPTQAELNAIALGQHPELEADGSPLEQQQQPTTTRQLGAAPAEAYATRQMSPKR